MMLTPSSSGDECSTVSFIVLIYEAECGQQDACSRTMITSALGGMRMGSIIADDVIGALGIP